MKLHLDQNAQYNTIARYDARHVMIGPARHEQNPCWTGPTVTNALVRRPRPTRTPADRYRY